MKKFIVDANNKKYIVEAENVEHATNIVNAILCKDAINIHGDDLEEDFKRLGFDMDVWGFNTSMSSGTLKQWEDVILRSLSDDMKEAAYDGDKDDVRYYKNAISKAKSILSTLKTKYKDSVKDEASPLQSINSLIISEQDAVAAYDVAIENLRGKIPEDSLQVLITTRDDENRHIENLQAVVNGTVTEKNLEDSMTNDFYNKFEKETDIDFLKESLSEMRRYERNWNYEGKKNAGCTLPELRQSIKFAEKRLHELKNKKDAITNDGLRLEEIESQLIKAQNEAKNKQWSDVSMRCEDIIATINQKH